MSRLVQIHNVIIAPEERLIFDPAVGRAVPKRDMSERRSDIDRIVHDGETYELQDDLSFLVPEDVAQHFLRQPGWLEGPNPFAQEHDEEEHKARSKTPRRPAAHKSGAKAGGKDEKKDEKE